MKNKKASHVGMILSFLIFITFVIFLFSVTSPLTRVDQDKQNTLDFLKIELLNNFSEDLSTVTVEFTAGSDCIRMDTLEGLEGLGAVVKGIPEELDIEEEIPIASEITPQGIIIAGTERKVKFYYSNQFNQSYGSVCPGDLSTVDPTIILFRTTTEIELAIPPT